MYAARSRLSILAIALLALTGCESDPAGPEAPSMIRVAGTYSAEAGFGAFELTTTADGTTTDWLALGATVQVTLRADGTTVGTVFIPGADEDGSDFEADLAGTWALEGDVVTFEHDSDTFIRDMAFEVEGETLFGEEEFDDVRVRMVLGKEG